MLYGMLYACLGWPNVSTKTMVDIGNLLNRGIGMSKIHFELFLQKEGEEREKRSRWSL